MTLERLAILINRECDNRGYFWACGIVKETIGVWNDKNISLLCYEARQMVEHYKAEDPN